MFSIIPSLKQIGLQVSWHMAMINVYFIKPHQHSPLPRILLVHNRFSMSSNKTTGCGNILNFIEIDTQICKKMDTKVFDFSENCDIDWRHSNWYNNVEHSGLYHHTKSERHRSVNVWMPTNTKVSLMKSHKYGYLPWILNGQYKTSINYITLINLNSIPNSI